MSSGHGFDYSIVMRTGTLHITSSETTWYLPFDAVILHAITDSVNVNVVCTLKFSEEVLE